MLWHEAMEILSATNPVQSQSHNAIGINCRLLASKLCHLADDGDVAALEILQIRGRDAGCRKLLRHCGALKGGWGGDDARQRI